MPNHMISIDRDFRQSRSWISRLPLELLLEVISHLDLQGLLVLLIAYPGLQKLTVIISDIDSPNAKRVNYQQPRPCIEELLINIDRYHFNDYSVQTSQLTGAKYIKIFDLSDACEQSESWHNSTLYFHRPCSNLAMLFSRENFRESERTGYSHIALITSVFREADRLTFIYSARTYFQRVHGLLSGLRWKTGCKLQLDPLPCLTHLVPKTPLRRSLDNIRTCSQNWSNLKELNLSHPNKIELGDLDEVSLATITFTQEGSYNHEPIFSIKSALNLRTLTINYIGEYVPIITVLNTYHMIEEDSELFYSSHSWGNLYEDFDCFKLIRNCDPRSPLPVADEEQTRHQMETYQGNMRFSQMFPSVSFIGVPDWFVLLYCGFSEVEKLHWERLDPTPMPRLNTYRLMLPKINEAYIRTTIPYDCLPLMWMGRAKNPAYSELLEVLDLTIEAPGFNHNGLLAFNMRAFADVHIRAYPYTTTRKLNDPALIINKEDASFWGTQQHYLNLTVSGDIYLKFLEEEPTMALLSRDCHDFSHWVDSNLDIARTVAMNDGKVSLRYFSPKFGKYQRVRLECPRTQETSVFLFSDTDTTLPEDQLKHCGKEFILEYTRTKLYIDDELVQEPDTSIRHQCYRHWVFERKIKKFEPCEEPDCLGCGHMECGHMDCDPN